MALQTDFENLPHSETPAKLSHSTAKFRNAVEDESNKPIVILFLASEPRNNAVQLQLGREANRIQAELERSANRDRFEFHQVHSVTVIDLGRELRRWNNRRIIVHFSGHGSAGGQLVFESEHGGAVFANADALADLFASFSNSVEAVVLNACLSKPQAEGIARSICHVIGMTNAIENEAAIGLSQAFYQGLGAGESVERASDIAKAISNVPSTTQSGATLVKSTRPGCGGEPTPSGRFRLDGRRVVDSLLGVDWQVLNDGNSITWRKARDACVQQGLRLTTAKELESLIAPDAAVDHAGITLLELLRPANPPIAVWSVEVRKPLLGVKVLETTTWTMEARNAELTGTALGVRASGDRKE